MIKALIFIGSLVLLALLIESVSVISVYRYKNGCEPIMSADQTKTWLECPIEQ